jgi:hypothetical protein
VYLHVFDQEATKMKRSSISRRLAVMAISFGVAGCQWAAPHLLPCCCRRLKRLVLASWRTYLGMRLRKAVDRRLAASLHSMLLMRRALARWAAAG